MYFARNLLLASAVLALLPAAGGANAAGCHVETIEVPVYMMGPQPHVKATVNDQGALFLLDTGAVSSVIATVHADRLQLPRRRMPAEFRLQGLGGPAEAQLAQVERFSFAGTTHHTIDFLTAGDPPSPVAIGLLGQNFLGATDIEFDLANGVMRLHALRDDCEDATANWAGAQAVYEAPLQTPGVRLLQEINSVAAVNGVDVTVKFDTGAAVSVLSLAAARRVGLTPDGAGVVTAGTMRGLGKGVAQSWIGPVRTFSLGGATWSDIRLRFVDVALGNVDMLIGADFFLSHRVYVAKDARRIRYAYNGGPMFNLAPPAADDDNDAPGVDAIVPPAIAARPPALASADAYFRRAAASLARNLAPQALEDFTRAIELEPGSALYWQQRARVRLLLGQREAALADLDQSLRIDPSDLRSRLLRARWLMDARKADQAYDDVAAVSATLAADAALRAQLARWYLALQRPRSAIDELDRWIPTHAGSAELPDAYNLRCWAGALANVDLDKALADCDRALAAKPDASPYLDSRGLVHVRRGEFDKAIADYDAALRLSPRQAWSLYGRGLARLGKGDVAGGEADLAAAKQANATVEAEARHYGLGPMSFRAEGEESRRRQAVLPVPQP